MLRRLNVATAERYLLQNQVSAERWNSGGRAGSLQEAILSLILRAEQSRLTCNDLLGGRQQEPRNVSVSRGSKRRKPQKAAHQTFKRQLSQVTFQPFKYRPVGARLEISIAKPSNAAVHLRRAKAFK